MCTCMQVENVYMHAGRECIVCVRGLHDGFWVGPEMVPEVLHHLKLQVHNHIQYGLHTHTWTHRERERGNRTVDL